MSTLTIVVTGTYLSPFSASDVYQILHGGYLYDPMASPFSFFYPTSVFGGEIGTVFSEYISGGEMRISYEDLPENNLYLDGHYVFCYSDVVFDFSLFDQTESRIIKIVFDPDNDLEVQTYDSYISNDILNYPELSSIKSTYYPSEDFYTLFEPKFTIYCEDGNVINITIPLTSVQCGIFDSYKDKTIVESIPSYKDPSNILLFINDNADDELTLTNVSTTLEFKLDEKLDVFSSFVTETPLAIPLGLGLLQQLLFSTIQIPLPSVNENPVLPPEPSATPTPTPTPVYGQGIVSLVNKDQIIGLGNGEDIYPLTDKGIVNMGDFQIYSFANEEMYPFAQNWILATGFWNDVGIWVDGETWD
jgi:hypothetical protein